MSHKKDTLFTIGQFAALHEINKKTLMWYDEIGLFKPAIIKKNGYRYYTYRQSSTLETILMLRELKVSIREIQAFMDHRSALNLEILLKKKTIELDKTIQHLSEIRKALIRKQKDLSILQGLQLSDISIVEEEEKYITVVKITKEMPLEKEFELLLKETKKHQTNRLYGISYGSMISVDSLYENDFDNYYAVFFHIPEFIPENKFDVQPKGKYLRAYCKGSWDMIPIKYNEILSYAREHHIELYGYAYETGINETVIDSIDEYITQIDIPIKTTG